MQGKVINNWCECGYLSFGEPDNNAWTKIFTKNNLMWRWSVEPVFSFYCKENILLKWSSLRSILKTSGRVTSIQLWLGRKKSYKSCYKWNRWRRTLRTPCRETSFQTLIGDKEKKYRLYKKRTKACRVGRALKTLCRESSIQTLGNYKNSLQHPVFRGGHPSKYLHDSMLLRGRYQGWKFWWFI